MMRVVTETGALRARWAVLMVLLVAVLVSGAGILYTTAVQRQADRRWCALLTSLDTPEAPPTTERGVRIQQQIHALRRQLRCGGTR